VPAKSPRARGPQDTIRTTAQQADPLLAKHGQRVQHRPRPGMERSPRPPEYSDVQACWCRYGCHRDPPNSAEAGPHGWPATRPLASVPDLHRDHAPPRHRLVCLGRLQWMQAAGTLQDYLAITRLPADEPNCWPGVAGSVHDGGRGRRLGDGERGSIGDSRRFCNHSLVAQITTREY
jgi:hypothetical protein